MFSLTGLDHLNHSPSSCQEHFIDEFRHLRCVNDTKLTSDKNNEADTPSLSCFGGFILESTGTHSCRVLATEPQKNQPNRFSSVFSNRFSGLCSSPALLFLFFWGGNSSSSLTLNLFFVCLQLNVIKCPNYSGATCTHRLCLNYQLCY